MDLNKTHIWLRRSAAASGMALSAMAVAGLLIRHLSLFLSSSPQFATIFAQLRHARIYTPLLLPAAVAFLFCLAADRLRQRSKPGFAVAVAGGVVLWLLLILAAAYLTFVNGILFGDVLLSLLDTLSKGGFDGL